MMPAVHAQQLPAMSDEAIDKVRRLESALLDMPQLPLETTHLFSRGTYARTVRIPAGAVLTGALIKIPTVLILSGHATVFTGTESIELTGHHVIPASAGRKQVFVAHAETHLTMAFVTSATTVEEAEAEFTDEGHLLMSRHQADHDLTTITGEQACQV